MALSPTAAVAARNTRNSAAIAALETALDEFLEEEFEGNQGIFDIPAGTKTAVYNEIVNRYRNEAWIIEERIDFHGNRQIVLQSPL
jgi:DNA-nicking Smr family endonuclease